MYSAGIILAGGIGARMGVSTPKQYLKINDREIISYSIETFKNSKIDDFLVVVESEESKKRIERYYDVVCIVGGKTRNKSLKAGLDFYKNNPPKKIVINAASRPFITENDIDSILELLKNNDIVCACEPITTWLEDIDGNQLNRDLFRLISSPEGYTYDIICKYYNGEGDSSFAGNSIPKQYSRAYYVNPHINLKITTKSDMEFIEKIIKHEKNDNKF